MINWHIISKIQGQLLLLEVTLMAACAAMAWLRDEADVAAFALSAAITLAAALALVAMGRRGDAAMSRRDAYVVVASVWVVFSLFGSLPFMFSGALPRPVDAFFETMSGFTTTGASLIDYVESLSCMLLFWRSLTQWIGGLGIVFFTIAVMPSMVGGKVRVFAAETGPLRTTLHPRLSTTGRWIWGIYATITAACALAFWAEGMTAFDAVNHAMTVAATGGFSTHNDTTGYFHDAAIDFTAIGFMFVCGVSFTLLYLAVFKHKWRQLLDNAELRFFVWFIIVATAVVAAMLWHDCGYTVVEAVRYALFQVVAFATTTGVFNDDVGQWPHAAWVVLMLCMFVGGCSGSTTGGFRCIRVVLLARIVRNVMRRLVHPQAVLPTRAGNVSIDEGQQVALLSFLAAYVAMCLFTYFVMVLIGVDGTNSMTIALSCASNSGVSLGVEVGAVMSWNDFPQAVKLLLALLMLMGRLEILSVLMLFTRAFWKDR